MILQGVPADLLSIITGFFDFYTFVYFHMTNKENSIQFNNEKNWFIYMNEMMYKVDPYNLYFKKNYKTNNIKLLFKNARLTFGVYYHRYLIDKYTISINDTRDYTWNIKKLSIIEINENKSDLDKMEMNILRQRIEFHKKRVNKYNELQYKFIHISKQYMCCIQNRSKELTIKNQTRILLLTNYLLDNNLFEYNTNYSISVDDLKKGFKKYSKRFIKIEPRIYEVEIDILSRNNLDKLTQLNIFNKYQNQHGGQNIYYVMNGPVVNSHINKYSFYKNDIISGLRFKA